MSEPKVKIDPSLSSYQDGYRRDPEIDKAIKNFKLVMLNELPSLIRTVAIIWFTLVGASIMLWIDGRM
jgi:hypothetical protein